MKSKTLCKFNAGKTRITAAGSRVPNSVLQSACRAVEFAIYAYDGAYDDHTAEEWRSLTAEQRKDAVESFVRTFESQANLSSPGVAWPDVPDMVLPEAEGPAAYIAMKAEQS